MLDMGTIAPAVAGLKFVKETISVTLDAVADAKAKDKIYDALSKLGSVQDTLFDLREELFRLQSENSALTAQLKERDDWKSRLDQYELKETEGGAVVYISKAAPQHYICPACTNKKEIQILQIPGDYTQGRCPGCDKVFQIRIRKNNPIPRVKYDFP